MRPGSRPVPPSLTSQAGWFGLQQPLPRDKRAGGVPWRPPVKTCLDHTHPNILRSPAWREDWLVLYQGEGPCLCTFRSQTGSALLSPRGILDLGIDCLRSVSSVKNSE
jgi:hypothetical protein